MIKNRVIKIVFFIIVYLTLSAILSYYFYVDKNARIKLYLTQSIQKLSSEYKATKNAYEMLANFFHDELAKDQQFLQTLLKARSEQKALQKLFQLLQPKFAILQKYSINYLTINDPVGNPIITLQKKITTKTLIKSKKSIFTNKKESANELLIEFSKPLYYNHTLIGVYKSAISYNVLRQKLQELFKGYYAYIINEKFINNKVFGYGNYLFVQSDLHPQFYYEQNAQITTDPREKEIIHAINLRIEEQVAKALTKEPPQSFALYTKVDGTYYTITFLPIKTTKPIGYLISYKRDNNLALFSTTFWQNTILANLALLLILAFIYHILETKSRFENMAVTDKLTKLYNRHKFYLTVPPEINRAKRSGKPFSIILFDIDKFKQINDRYGHNTGDYILKTVAQLVRSNVRSYDSIFRWGGEEFLILAPETNAKQAMQLAEKIRKIIESHSFDILGQVTISVGVAEFNPQTDANIDRTIKRADNALYVAKKEGRNRVALAS